jgi:hypothetical protein
MPSLPAARFSTRPSLRTRCFHFYGWGGFEIRLARRRAHPCDEQGVASTCSFCLYMRTKIRDSILWVGPVVEIYRNGSGVPESRSASRPQRSGGGGEDPAQLYKYNGNLLQLSTFASLKLLPAIGITACGNLSSACRNKKSAGGKSFCLRGEPDVE